MGNIGGGNIRNRKTCVISSWNSEMLAGLQEKWRGHDGAQIGCRVEHQVECQVECQVEYQVERFSMGLKIRQNTYRQSLIGE